MRINKALLAAVVFSALIIGVLIGYYLRNAREENGSLNLNPLPRSCRYEGKTYRSGDGFQAEDGCNSCSCNDGEVMCTTMACE